MCNCSIFVSFFVIICAKQNTHQLIICIQAPIFDPSTTDDPDFYVVEVSIQDGSHPITRNVPASTDPLMISFNDLMKGTIYRARIVAYNDRGVGTFTDFFTAQMRIDRKLMTMPNTNFMHRIQRKLLPCMAMHTIICT